MVNQIESIPLSAAQLDQISTLCAQHKVARLYLFGSVLTDDFRPDSDIDFLVQFQKMDILDYADNYFGLLNAFKEVLEREVDLVIEKDLSNPVLIEEIDAHKLLIYEQENPPLR